MADLLRRASTGIQGLDAVLGGGLPRNALYLIHGSPGVGKTTLALQFLLDGARRGESALYIALTESRQELRAVGESHGWKLDGVSIFETGRRARTGGSQTIEPHRKRQREERSEPAVRQRV
jgi:circadian clock protein KaiC